jgi:hypothetical protein
MVGLQGCWIIWLARNIMVGSSMQARNIMEQTSQGIFKELVEKESQD